MKKLALTFAIVLGLSLCSFAQNGGGIFGYGQTSEEEESYNIAWYSFYQNEEVDNGLFGLLRAGNMPNLPIHEQTGNQDAPLTGGALLLIGFGAAYAVAKRRKE